MSALCNNNCVYELIFLRVIYIILELSSFFPSLYCIIFLNLSILSCLYVMFRLLVSCTCVRRTLYNFLRSTVYVVVNCYWVHFVSIIMLLLCPYCNVLNCCKKIQQRSDGGYSLEMKLDTKCTLVQTYC